MKNYVIVGWMRGTFVSQTDGRTFKYGKLFVKSDITDRVNDKEFSYIGEQTREFKAIPDILDGYYPGDIVKLAFDERGRVSHISKATK